MRQVYFDPFGMYTEGLDKGISRQMDIEKQSRDARDSDYKFNVLNPFELNRIRRDDWLGERVLPLRYDQIKYDTDSKRNAVFGSNLGIADAFGERTGVAAPIYNTFGQHYGLNYVTDPTTGAMRIESPQGSTWGTIADPNRAMQDYLLRDQAMKEAEFGLRAQQQAANLQNAAAPGELPIWAQVQIWQQRQKALRDAAAPGSASNWANPYGIMGFDPFSQQVPQGQIPPYLQAPQGQAPQQSNTGWWAD